LKERVDVSEQVCKRGKSEFQDELFSLGRHALVE